MAGCIEIWKKINTPSRWIECTVVGLNRQSLNTFLTCKIVKNIRLLNISDASYIITGYFLQIFLRKFEKNIRLLKISSVKNIRFLLYLGKEFHLRFAFIL